MLNKRGQVSLFVIGAIVLVGVIAALFLFPKTRSLISGQELDPNNYLRNCIGPSIQENMEMLSSQGGYSNPENFMLYQDNKVQYLCYTSEFYETCQVQQPMIKKHYEQELGNAVRPIARQCISDLKQEYEGRGYSVSSSPGELNLTFVPGKLIVEFLSPFTVTKESAQTFRKFGVEVPSEMYDLLLTATSIVEFESSLGDSETLLYIQYYPDLKIDKVKGDEGTLYRLTNVVTKESFTFASRSLEWPPGYGNEEVLG